MNVLGISGSLRQQSSSRRALELALAGATSAGAKTQLLDLRELDLPLYDEDEVRYTRTQRAAVSRLQKAAQQAGAFLLASPEYHGGMSGVFKNALDHLAGRHFRGKAAGVLAVAGGRVAPVSTAQMLHTVLRQLGAHTLPQQVLIPEAEKLFDDDGGLADEELRRRLEELGAAVVRLGRLLLQGG